MEKERPKMTVAFLAEKDLHFGILVTDKHRSIVKWVRENLPETVSI